MAAMSKRPASPTHSRRLSEDPTWFDKLPSWKRDGICVAFLYLVVVLLFNQFIFSDSVFYDTADTAAAMSWSQAGKHLEETEHIEPLWFPYVFGGMPVFGSLAYGSRDVSYVQQVLHFVGKILFLGSSLSWLLIHYFLAGLFMYMLARSLKIPEIPSLLAAFTLMMNPYAIALAGHGQGSKMMALSYIPLLLLLTVRLFQKKDLLSFGLLCMTVGTLLLTNHVQMAFYGFLVIGCYAIFEIVTRMKSAPGDVVRNIGLFTAAIVVGFLISSFVYLSVQEYAEYSVRGGGGATGESTAVKSGGGMSYETATNWSLHPLELFNYIIPTTFGFSSATPTEINGQVQTLPLYWGWMPFTTTTIYVGILPLVLSLLALLYARQPMTIFLFALSVLLALISFGKHLPIVYDMLFYYLPYFNKFRAPSMILHLIPITSGLLAAFGAMAILDMPERSKDANFPLIRKRLLIALAVAAGLFVLLLIGKSGLQSFFSDFMFQKEGEEKQYQREIVQMLQEQRFEIFWSGTLKSLAILAASLAVIVGYFSQKLSRGKSAMLLAGILVIDLYLMDEKFIDPKPASTMEQHFERDATVTFLQSDTSVHRIFPLGELFADNTFMYHTIQSIGGYSPAKLRIYQELIDSCLYRGTDPQFPLNMNVVNMLNAKYFVAKGRLPEDRLVMVNADQAKQVVTYLNPSYLPRAWFVGDTRVAETKRGVLNLLNSVSFDPKRTAILEKPMSQTIGFDSASTVELPASGYKAHEMSIRTNSSVASLLVVSEVYYPAGWKAFIDGAETEIFKTNYVLRSVYVPAGSHMVEFRFEPKLYEIGFTVTHAAWGLTVLVVIAGTLMNPGIRKKVLGKKGELPQGTTVGG